MTKHQIMTALRGAGYADVAAALRDCKTCLPEEWLSESVSYAFAEICFWDDLGIDSAECEKAHEAIGGDWGPFQRFTKQ